jgi:predicted RNase H-like nuclease (RuvC/YqgF family)
MKEKNNEEHESDIFDELNIVEKSLRRKKKERRRRKKKGKKTRRLDNKISKLSRKCRRLKKVIKNLKAEAKRRPTRSIWDDVIVTTAPIFIARTFDLIEGREKRGKN